MTYPQQGPQQQPGPGGWGPHSGVPGTPGQAGPPQQRPAWYGNQHAGWAAPPQPNPAGQPPQQPYPPQQAPPWGGEFGQPTWTREPGGFGDVQPPRKKSKLPWIFGAVAVVVAAGVAGGLYLLLGSGPGDARPVAQGVVDKVNAHDFAAIDDQLCQSNRAELGGQLTQLKQGQYDLRLGNVSTHGDRASAQVTGTYTMHGASESVDQTMTLTVENGQWKVCQLG